MIKNWLTSATAMVKRRVKQKIKRTVTKTLVNVTQKKEEVLNNNRDISENQGWTYPAETQELPRGLQYLFARILQNDQGSGRNILGLC